MVNAAEPSGRSAFSVDIQLIGWRDRRGRFARPDDLLREAQRAALTEAMDLALTTAKELTPVGARPFGESDEQPHLRDTWRIDFGFEAQQATLVNDQERAVFLFQPTRPHDISPRKAQALRFMGQGGQVVFAKHVYHPGTPGNDVPMKLMQRLNGPLVTLLNKAAVQTATAIEQVFR